MARRSEKGQDLHDAYPIRTVARLTGLSPDLIRAWERRYDAVEPVRGPRGARLYTREDVEHLRLLATLVGTGRSIGDVAHLDSKTLQALASEAEPAAVEERGSPEEAQQVVDHVLVALARFDSREVAHLLGEAIVGMGSGAFVRDVCGPLLTEVGDRWSQGRLSVAEEHLVSGALRNLIDSLGRLHALDKPPVAMLAAPSGERHEFGLLIVGLLFVEEGLTVAHAGVDLPDVEIVSAARQLGVRTVGLSLVNGTNRQRAVRQVQRIADSLPAGVELWLGGRDAPNVASKLSGSGFLVLEETGEVEAQIRRLREITPVSQS